MFCRLYLVSSLTVPLELQGSKQSGQMSGCWNLHVYTSDLPQTSISSSVTLIVCNLSGALDPIGS